MSRLALLFLAASAATLSGQGWPTIRWERWITGLEAITDIQSPRDGSGRLFVIEQRGRIRVIRDGALAPNPVLDIVPKVQFGGEMGLLGLAFPPGFAGKQYFYVNYVDRQRRSIIARYRISGNTADPASEEILLTLPQPFTNHNAGQLAFGPDGFLYIGWGDGGSANDPQKNSQNPATLLGKMLRIDTENGERPYGIPPSNPRQQGRPPEVWATGLRNPWRYSFDRETGELYIADVGQGAREEIHVQPASSQGGENYGWSLMEGNNCFDDRNCASRTDLVRPVFDYPRSDGISVTGGYVYRGAKYPALRGIYIFGDYGSRMLFGLRRNGMNWESHKFGATSLAFSTFGEDEDGELLAADYGSGVIYKLASDAPRFAVNSIVSAASFTGQLAPGAIATAFLNPIPGVSGLTAAQTHPLPTTLSGVSARWNTTPLPLYAVTSNSTGGQLNFQLPFDAAGDGTLSVTAGSDTAQFPLRITPLAPAIFQLANQQAAALKGSDNSVVSPSNPVVRGEAVVVYATGLGAVTNQPIPGAPAPADPLATTRAATELLIGGRPAQVFYSGLAPFFAGLYQINAFVPADAPSGQADIALRVGGVSSTTVKLQVR